MKIYFVFVCLILVGCGDVAKSLEEGKAYGKSHTLSQCIDESISKLEMCEDMKCVSAHMGFPRGCAKTASLDQQFCSTLPATVIEAANAIKQQCSTHQFPKACYKYMQQPVSRCY
ncbi:MAG: hypothetical protein ACPGYT_10575 [Nitrospirales bacterium]